MTISPTAPLVPARPDVVVIGGGLGGLSAAAILARAGRRVVLLERSNSVGGAASSYKVGDLFVEGSLHAMADPRKPQDPKHALLSRAGVIESVTFVRTRLLYEVRGGPVGAPLRLPDTLDGAGAALGSRFAKAKPAITAFLAELAAIAGGEAVPEAERGWSLAQKLDAAFGEREALKCAVAANLTYWHDDAATLPWPDFARAQGGFLVNGGAFVDGGSQRLSSALARAVRAAGGTVLVRRAAQAIAPLPEGGYRITHTTKDGEDPQTIETPRLVGAMAPERLAAMLPDAEAAALRAGFAAETPSMSLFALTLGLARPPLDLGVTSYATQLLPPWMKSLADMPRATALLGGEPGEMMPPLAIADYAGIESGVPAPPFVLSVIGPDRADNWQDADAEAYRARRNRWQKALIGYLDEQYRGLAGAVRAASFNTAHSVAGYLGHPGGAVYGFAPRLGADPLRHVRSALPDLYFGSAWCGGGGFHGALQGGAAAADAILADG